MAEARFSLSDLPSGDVLVMVTMEPAIDPAQRDAMSPAQVAALEVVTALDRFVTRDLGLKVLFSLEG